MKKQPMKFEPMKLGKLNLRPHDVLVISSDRPISHDVANRLKEQFEKFPLRYKNKVIVLSNGLKLGKITHE